MTMSPSNGSYSSVKNNHGIIEEADSNSTAISSSNREALKLYEVIMFSGPIVLILIILMLFYLFYLRRHSVDWSSLRNRMHSSPASVSLYDSPALGVTEVGLKKEFREMLPVIIYKDSISVKDTLCSVCLGDYQPDDKLQQIPGCGHTFHLKCIDHWLTTRTTCPLCRLSLTSSSKAPSASDPDSHTHDHTSSQLDSSENGDHFLWHHSLQV